MDPDLDLDLARAFDEQRHRLVAVAHRLLGSRADAEDVVQESWLRLARQAPGSIENLSAWLTTVVSRACIDVLRARRAGPDEATDDRLPELVVTEDDDAPEARAVLSESVGLALLVVLESLGPDERLALVLHDMFAVPFEEIGQIIGKSTAAAKMAASRARRKVRGPSLPTHGDSRERQREVVDAFLAATRAGDLEGLLRVLDPDVTWRIHSERGVVVRQGATTLAAAARNGARAAEARRVSVNGAPGVLVWDRSGTVRGVMACTVVGGRIVELVSVIDPRRLAEVELPPIHQGADPDV